MLSGKTFHLRSATIAIEQTKDGRVALTVPEGAIVRVIRGPTPTDNRMVDVEWNGKRLVMFAVDIQERGEMASGSNPT